MDKWFEATHLLTSRKSNRRPVLSCIAFCRRIPSRMTVIAVGLDWSSIHTQTHTHSPLQCLTFFPWQLYMTRQIGRMSGYFRQDAEVIKHVTGLRQSLCGSVVLRHWWLYTQQRFTRIISVSVTVFFNFLLERFSASLKQWLWNFHLCKNC